MRAAIKSAALLAAPNGVWKPTANWPKELACQALLDKHGMTLVIPSAGVRFSRISRNRDFAGMRSVLEGPGSQNVRFPIAPG